jgi:copper homeostasis protein
MAPLLEVIVTSVEDALEAERGGADRLELVEDLVRGGMTPSIGLTEAVLDRVQIPVRVMVRETESHEVNDASTVGRLEDAARAIGRLPIDGLVMGFLRGGDVDEGLLSRLTQASSCAMTFHRAFESVADESRALTALRRLPQIDRILTGGGSGDWTTRSSRLVRLAEAAAPELTVIVGGGVPFEALAAIAGTPVLREVHLGRAVRSPAAPEGRVTAPLVREALRALGR